MEVCTPLVLLIYHADSIFLDFIIILVIMSVLYRTTLQLCHGLLFFLLFFLLFLPSPHLSEPDFGGFKISERERMRRGERVKLSTWQVFLEHFQNLS